MMQLAKELKTLAREFSLAVVVSVAVPCPLCAVVRSPGEVLELQGGRSPLPAEQEKEAVAPRCGSASLQPRDFLFQQVCSKNRADLLPALIAVLSQQGICLIEQGRVKYSQIKRFLFIFDITPFKGLASVLSDLLLSYLGGAGVLLANCVCFSACRQVAVTTINGFELGKSQQKMVKSIKTVLPLL